jgi:hypothetical protein
MPELEFLNLNAAVFLPPCTMRYVLINGSHDHNSLRILFRNHRISYLKSFFCSVQLSRKIVEVFCKKNATEAQAAHILDNSIGVLLKDFLLAKTFKPPSLLMIFSLSTSSHHP